MERDLNVGNNIKKSLINWYNFTEGADILYIGNSEEAWMSGIACPNGRVEAKTVKELLESDFFYQSDLKYDYIVLIEKLEYIQNPGNLLCIVRAILKETGVLLLGMNNRLGLRYFCGDRDKYTGRNFDGIENYKRAYSRKEDIFAGRMYSRAEMKKMLCETGFPETKFYSVLSNLENPTVLVADNYYPNEDLLNRVSPLYDSPETIFLEEEGMYQSLIENGMFHQMANAYLCECSLEVRHFAISQIISFADREETNALEKYYKQHRRNTDVLIENRQRMNYSEERYEKLFVNIFERVENRKLILFGSGYYAKRFISIFARDYDVYAIIDNDPCKWGTTLEGIEIYSPDILQTMDSAEYKVIICIRDYVSVMKQLDDMGIGGYSIYEWNRSYPKKIKNAVWQGDLCNNEEKALTKKKYHIGYVAGAFDMFHVGHLNLLRKAKEQCDYLIAGVIADETIYDIKKKRPIIPLADRVEIVSACKYVDQAEPLPVFYNGIKEAYKMFHFDVQFSGDDHKDDEKWLEDKAYLESQGADIVFFEYTNKVSSTKLREQLKSF